MAGSHRQLTAGLAAIVIAMSVVACGETTSTSSFSGERHNVAQTVADFQSDATAGSEEKLCQNDLAGTLTTRLQGAGGCRKALKSQLHQIDSLGLTIESITVKGTTAEARVKSTYSGKNRITTLTLVREGSRWKISGVVGSNVAPGAHTKG